MTSAANRTTVWTGATRTCSLHSRKQFHQMPGHSRTLWWRIPTQVATGNIQHPLDNLDERFLFNPTDTFDWLCNNYNLWDKHSRDTNTLTPAAKRRHARCCSPIRICVDHCHEDLGTLCETVTLEGRVSYTCATGRSRGKRPRLASPAT
jgi:hypothetical protein